MKDLKKMALVLALSMVLSTLILVAIMYAAPARADTYGIVSGGMTQSGGSGVSDDRGFLGVLGIGARVNDVVSLEFDYRWLGDAYGVTGDKVLDPSMTNTGTVDKPVYVCSTNPCNHNVKYAASSAKGVGLSALFEYTLEEGRIGYSFRIGSFYRSTRYASHWEAPITGSSGYYTANSSDIAAMYGLGLRFGDVRAEVVHYTESFYYSGRVVPLTALYISYLNRF